METKLAIIIPTYDSLDTLKVLVKNIFDYTDGDFSVYIVEDGQNKETRKWLKTQPVVSILHKKNKGIAPSWNDGLKQAMADSCTHFAILNDDIEIPENWWKDCQMLFNKPIHMVSLVSSFLITGWFFIIDRYCVEKIGYFDENFAPYMSEDFEYYYRFISNKLRMGRINLNVFHHGSRTINKVAKLDIKKFKQICSNNWNKLRVMYPKIKMYG